MSDEELLAAYLEQQSQNAFTQLVQRYAPLIYAAARRQAGDTHAADVTQAVFIVLAKKAASLHGRGTLAGWLLKATHYAAREALRGEHRLKRRERAAVAMAQSGRSISDEAIWTELRPMVDQAMLRLRPRDRDVVAMRFLQSKSLLEVGDAMGITEDAARKRVDRALQRLRKHLRKSGAVVEAGVLGSVLSLHGLETPPAAVFATKATVHAIGISKGAILLMTAKTKMVVGIALAVSLLSGGSAWLWYAHRPSASVALTAIDEGPKKTQSASHQTLNPNRPLPLARVPSPISPPTTAPNQPQQITSMTLDKSGNVWIASEDHGISCYSPSNGKWEQFGKEAGLPEAPWFAIACDKAGRIWAGSVRQGLYVFNGKTWRNYDVIEGPIGERIFNIKVCPTDGDVWIATNAGLTRYSPQSDSWSNITHANGLPTDHISCMAFDAGGDLFVGTQCEGVAIATAKANYQNWRLVKGPSETAVRGSGEGLPSNLINDVYVARDGTCYVATDAGLAWSKDRFHWKYTRGGEWVDKGKQLADPPKRMPAAPDGAKLVEDFVASVSEDDTGQLWIGYRHAGWDHVSLPNLFQPFMPVREDARAMVVVGDHDVLSGRTLRRWREVISEPISGSPGDDRIAFADCGSLPARAVQPAPSDLERMREMVASLVANPQLDQPIVVPLADDWRTQGNWVGRYGRYWACLAAMVSPDDYVWRPGQMPVEYAATIGPHHAQGDSLRYWISSNYDSSPSALEMSSIYFDSRLKKKLTTDRSMNHRPAFWNDNGEVYPANFDGPHTYCSIKVPDGYFILSMYQMGSPSTLMDLPVSIRLHDPEADLYDVSGFKDNPELARSRCAEYGNGCYTRFLVRGPAELTIEVNRNYSFNSNLGGVMLDMLDEKPPPYFQTWKDWEARKHQHPATTKSIPSVAPSASHDRSRDAADRLFAVLADAQKRTLSPRPICGSHIYRWLDITRPQPPTPQQLLKTQRPLRIWPPVTISLASMKSGKRVTIAWG